MEEVTTEMSDGVSTIARLNAEIVNLLEEYSNKIHIESVSDLTTKRAEIAHKCAEAARYCMKQSTAIQSKFFHFEAANFASNGRFMDPYNFDCQDILIEVFKIEKDNVESAIFERYYNTEEEIVLMQLVKRDIDGGWAKNLVFQ